MSTGIADQPGSREPGLDQLIKALTADGYPHELAGRDAALEAFRVARSQSRRRTRFTVFPGASVRLSTVAAALVAAFAGLTAAAYAKALPASIQHIAYSVLSPFGVPDNQPAPAGHPVPSQRPSAGHDHDGRRGTPSPSATRFCPCPAKTSHPAIRGSALAIIAARVQLPADGWDQFTGRLTYHGRPESGVRIQLLEQPAGSAGWTLAGSAVTGGRGRVRIGVPHLTQNATFELAGPDGVGSISISITVIPRVQLWRVPAQSGTDRLVASSHFGDVGDVVVLEELTGGTWQSVASGTLDAGNRVTFDLPASKSGGHYYRAQLHATSAHGGNVSTPVFLPHVKPPAGARVIVPEPGKSKPGDPGHGIRHRQRFPGPVTPGPVPSPSPSPPPGPVLPGPAPSPSPTSPPGPVLPGPVPSTDPSSPPGPVPPGPVPPASPTAPGPVQP